MDDELNLYAELVIACGRYAWLPDYVLDQLRDIAHLCIEHRNDT